jgi:hypothetical protein
MLQYTIELRKGTKASYSLLVTCGSDSYNTGVTYLDYGFIFQDKNRVQ